MSKPTRPALEALLDIADRSSMLRETKDATLDSVAQQARAAIPALEALLAERDLHKRRAEMLRAALEELVAAEDMNEALIAAMVAARAALAKGES